MAKTTKGRAAVEKTANALSTLTVEYVPWSQLKPNGYNPNRQNDHEFTLLLRSITEDGFTQPIIVADGDVIVDGEHRWRAAGELGIDPVPIVRVPMSPEQARIATLRHNRARGSEDLELSVQVLRDLEQLGALDWAADSLDMSDDELTRLLEDIPAPEALAADEFSEAWTPARAGHEGQNNDGSGAWDSTASALNAEREREKAIKAAKNDEERQKLASDRAVYRLSLVFSDEEAEIVKRVLGAQPAEMLLVLCRNADAQKAASATSS